MITIKTKIKMVNTLLVLTVHSHIDVLLTIITLKFMIIPENVMVVIVMIIIVMKMKIIITHYYTNIRCKRSIIK